MRSLARETVYKFLFSQLFNPGDEEIFSVLCKNDKLNNEEIAFATNLLNAVQQNYNEIISEIEKFSIGYKIDRIFSTDKCAVFTVSSLRKFLSSFDGISITVAESIEYHSSSINLELDKGYQSLSGEKVLNYLMICKDEYKEKVLCEIITSVLMPEYVDNGSRLFKSFANNSKTDISIIDYSNSFDTVKTYCYADDKFEPVPFYMEEINEENM